MLTHRLMARKTRLVAAAGAAIVGLAVTACGSSQAAGSSNASGSATSGSAAPTTVRILSYPTSGSSWLAYIADKQGFFKKHGIDASLVSLPAGQQGGAALAGGSLDVGVLDVNNMGPLIAKGGKYTLIAGDNVNYWTLIGNKNLAGDTKNLESALKDIKAISVPSLGGSGARVVQVTQEAYGIDSSALQLIADPSSASFTSGRVGGYMTDTLDSCEPLDEGYPKLMDFADPPAPKSSYPKDVQNLIGLAGLGYWASNDFLSAHQGLAANFQAAIADTIAWSKDSSHLATIAKMFRGTTWDFPKLNDSQWKACAQRVVNDFHNAFTDHDATTWNAILKSQGIAPLPARSTIVASGVPQS